MQEMERRSKLTLHRTTETVTAETAITETVTTETVATETATAAAAEDQIDEVD